MKRRRNVIGLLLVSSVLLGTMSSCSHLAPNPEASIAPKSTFISDKIREVGTSKPFGISPGVSLGQVVTLFPALELNYNGFLESQIDELNYRPFTSIELYFSKNQRITGFQLTTDYIPTTDDGAMLKERYSEMITYISAVIKSVSPVIVDTVDHDVTDPQASWMSRLSEGVTIGKEKLNATWANPETRSTVTLYARAVGQRNGFLNLKVKFSW